MRQLGIKELRGCLAEALEDLPFEITKKGKVIAIVLTPITASGVTSTEGQAPAQIVPETKQTTAGVLRQYKSLGSVPCSKEYQLRRK